MSKKNKQKPNKPVTNKDIIGEFKKAAAVLEIIDDHPFRVRAYQNAIDTIINLDEELSVLYKRMDLSSMSGIGKELSEKIVDLVETGESRDLNELFSKVPAGMFSLLEIPKIGPKKAYALAEHFKLTDAETAAQKLKQAAKDHQIQELEGFGEKSETQILENIDRPKPKTDRMLLSKADTLAQKIIKYLVTIPEVEKAIAMGSIRRRRETVGDIDIGVATTNPNAVVKTLKQWDYIHSIEASGTNVNRLVLPNNKQVDIKFSKPNKFGAMLQHFTGSKQHNIALREHALSLGYSLSEHGIKQSDTSDKNNLKQFDNEIDFYNFLECECIEPELRENNGEIEAAQNNQLPNLINQNDIKGDFHTHTNYDWSSSHDYGAPLTDLFNQAVKLEYQWLAIGDHNPSRTAYDEKEIIQQIKQRSQWIKDTHQQWQKETNQKLSIFITLEIDIHTNGNLSVPDKALDYLDFAIVAVHANFTLPLKKQTNRVITALKHPKVKILAHPTGRLIGDREPMQLEWDTLFKYCKEHDKAFEINSNPRRLDLPDTLVKQSVENKVKLALGTDTHHIDHLSFMPYGLGIARRGWAQPSDILNTLTYNKLRNWLEN